MDIKEKITQLKMAGYAKESIHTLNIWGERIDEIAVKQDFAGHQHSKALASEYKDAVAGINEVLSEDRHKTEAERQYLYGMKDAYTGIIRELTYNGQDEIEAIEKDVNDEMQNES